MADETQTATAPSAAPTDNPWPQTLPQGPLQQASPGMYVLAGALGLLSGNPGKPISDLLTAQRNFQQQQAQQQAATIVNGVADKYVANNDHAGFLSAMQHPGAQPFINMLDPTSAAALRARMDQSANIVGQRQLALQQNVGLTQAQSAARMGNVSTTYAGPEMMMAGQQTRRPLTPDELSAVFTQNVPAGTPEMRANFIKENAPQLKQEGRSLALFDPASMTTTQLPPLQAAPVTWNDQDPKVREALTLHGVNPNSFNALSASNDPRDQYALQDALSKATYYKTLVERSPQTTNDLIQAAAKARVKFNPILGLNDPNLTDDDKVRIASGASALNAAREAQAAVTKDQALFQTALTRPAIFNEKLADKTWIDPATYLPINKANVNGMQLIDAANKGLAVPVSDQDGQMIEMGGNLIQQAKDLRPLIAKLKPLVTTPGQTLKQALDLAIDRGLMSRAETATFGSIVNQMALEVTKIATNSSRPGVTIFQNVKEEEAPNLKESAQNSFAKIDALDTSAHNQIHSKLGLPRWSYGDTTITTPSGKPARVREVTPSGR